MSATTKVILLTGFLGSGKTSLLNRIIAAVPEKVKLLILVNEFGELDVDGALLDKQIRKAGLDLIEISKGSIFCACIKEDFIKSLIRISEELQPDLLIMEATGVANPSDLQRDLRMPLFRGRFKLAEQICLLDAQNFLNTRNIFVSVDKQLASSTMFVLNKTDLATPEELAEIRAAITEAHPDPIIYEAQYADIPLDGLLAPIVSDDENAPAPSGAPVGKADVGKVMSGMLLDPFREMTPPENLTSRVVSNPSSKPEAAAAFLRGLPDTVVRGKGFYRDGGSLYLVERIVKTVNILPINTPIATSLEGRMALIYPPQDSEAIDAAFEKWCAETAEKA